MLAKGGLLRQRDFRLLWIGETVSTTGTATATLIIPVLAVSVLRASTFYVAALTAAAYLPWLVIGIPAGAWADRLPSRTLMISCDIAAAALYASLPVAAWCGVLTADQVLGVALAAGAVNVLFATSYQVLLPDLVTPAELVEGNAKLQGSASMATITGRGTAGLAVVALGPGPAVLLNAASFLVSAGCLLRIRPAAAGGRVRTGGTTVRYEIKEGVRFVVRDRYLRPLTWYAAAANLAFSGYTSLAVLFLVKTAGLSVAAAGLLLSAGAVGGLGGALVARRVAGRFGTPDAVLLTALITGPAGLLIPLTRGGPWAACFAAGAAVLGAGNLIGNIVVSAFRQA